MTSTLSKVIRGTIDLKGLSPSARRCRRKFLRIFPGGFRDETYIGWEREYKWTAHMAWCGCLTARNFGRRCWAAVMLKSLQMPSGSNHARTCFFLLRRWRCSMP